jgi:peptidoglycan/LPS O-acetylase OafA/YrhL
MDNKARYQELDALRGLAALMVVFFHFTMGRPEAKFGFKYGTTGVDLFFIISGFVIFMSLTKVKNSREFIINRVSRLYPTYWTCVSFTFLLIVIANFFTPGDISFIQYLGNMTMFQYYLRIPDLDGSYWTMIIEMVFYIGILILFQFRLLKQLNIFGIAACLIAVISIRIFPNQIVYSLFGAIPLLQFIPLFFAGTIFYRMYTEKTNLFRNYGLLAFCWVCQILLFNYAGRSRMFITHIEYVIMLTLYFSLFTLFINGKLKFIVSNVSLFLGKISFALYLIHEHISIDIIIPVLVNKFNLNFWVASFGIALPIVIGLAALITYYVEVPLSKKMKEKLRMMSGTLKPTSA